MPVGAANRRRDWQYKLRKLTGYGRERSLCTLSALIVCLLATGPAKAGLKQATCSSDQYDQPFTVKLGAHQFDRDSNDHSRYGHRQHNFWPLLVNWNVQYLLARIGPNFLTESVHDFIKVTSGTNSVTYSGNWSAGTLVFWPIATTPFGHLINFGWHSDNSVNQASFPHFDQLRAWCHPTEQATTPMPPLGINKRYDAVLIKPGDVIYMSVYQPAFSHLVLTADVDSTATTGKVDFDMYASLTTAMPDYSNYTWKDTSTAQSASIDVGDTVKARWVYFLIRSYAGAGTAIIHANTQRVDQKETLEICLNGSAAGTLGADHREMFKVASASLMRATLGNYLVHGYTVNNIPDCADEFCRCGANTCDVCVSPATLSGCHFQVSRSSSDARARVPPLACPDYGNAQWAGVVLAHELAHSRLGLGMDEYDWDNNGYSYCGHTLMNGPKGNASGLCTEWQHCQDGQVGQNAPERCGAGTSNWSLLAPRFYGHNLPAPSESADPSFETIYNESFKNIVFVGGQ